MAVYKKPDPIAANIKKFREYCDLTREEVGKKLNPRKSEHTIAAYESGARQPPEEVLGELAKIFRVKVGHFSQTDTDDISGNLGRWLQTGAATDDLEIIVSVSKRLGFDPEQNYPAPPKEKNPDFTFEDFIRIRERIRKETGDTMTGRMKKGFNWISSQLEGICDLFFKYQAFAFAPSLQGDSSSPSCHPLLGDSERAFEKVSEKDLPQIKEILRDEFRILVERNFCRKPRPFSLDTTDSVFSWDKYVEMKYSNLQNEPLLVSDLSYSEYQEIVIAYKQLIENKTNLARSNEIQPQTKEVRINIAGVINMTRKLYTKKDQAPMSVFKITDLEGTIDAIIFPEPYKEYGSMVIDNTAALFSGIIMEEDGGGQKLQVLEILPAK